MQRQLDEVYRELKTVNRRLDGIEPVTRDISRWKERFIGMRMLIIVVSAALGAALATFGKWLLIKPGWAA